VEWAVLLLFLAAAGAYIAWPRAADASAEADTAPEVRREFAALVAVLRELDEDLAAGRITEAERARERRDTGARLRAIAEALRALGEPVDAR
jgi:hypothetical protein